VVKAKVVAILEIKILDSSSHTEVVEEVNLKARGAVEDMAIGIDNNLDQILKIVIIVANQAIGPENVKRRKMT
jgi:hypothetical protein